MQDTSARNTIVEFLDAMYGTSIGGQAQVVLWSSVKGASVLWCHNLGHAADAALSYSKRVDAYFQPCLHSPTLMADEVVRRNSADGKMRDPAPRKRRGYHESTTIMPGVWVDIDTMEGNHKAADDAKNVLPETTPDVVAMLGELPLEPTYIIKTGGGVHAYWLFDEPFELLTEDDREEARNLSYAWQVGVVRSAMLKHGWNAMDSTFDLPRVMRVPGTLNRKYNPPRDVTVLDRTNNRYTPDDLLQYAPREFLEAPERGRSADSKPLPPVEPNAVPSKRVMDMCDVYTEFKNCWDGHTRYKSQSERDLAIASYLVHSVFDFTDEEIHEALVINRRKHGGQDKSGHATYYPNTIDKARRSKTTGTYGLNTSADAKERRKLEIERDEAQLAELTEKFDEVESALVDSSQSANDARAMIISSIAEHLGVPPDKAIIGIEEYARGGGKRANYTLVGTPGKVDLGEMVMFSRQVVFDSAIRELFRVPMKPMRAKEWNMVHGMLLRVIDRVDVGEDGTTSGGTERSLRLLIEQRCGDVIVSDSEVAVKNHQPWLEDGKVCLVASQALDEISKLSQSIRWDQIEFCKRLRNIGAETRRRKMGGRKQGVDRRRNVSYWVLPYDAEYWVS